MEKILFKSLLVLFPLLFGIVNASYGSELKVLSSSDRTFHFVLSVSPDKLDYQYERDSLKAYYEAVLVGIPYGATVRLAATDGRDFTSFADNNHILKNLSTVSHSLVELSDVTTLRRRRIVTVRVYPLTNNGYFKEVEVQLAFEGSRNMQNGVVPDDPTFDRIFRTVIANYDVFRTWSVPERPIAKQAVVDGPFASGSEWLCIKIAETGLYKISGAQLEEAGLLLNSLSSASIHLFNGGGKPLPVNNDTPRPDFTEVAIIVNDGGDGVFDAQDYILFYGEAVDRWIYQAGFSPSYINNRYERENSYWLTTSGGSGLRMGQVDAAPGGMVDTTITTFRRRLHTEQDNLLRIYDDRITDYFTWYWTDQPSLTFFINTPGAISGENARFVLDGRTFAPGFMEMSVNDSLATDTCNQFNCRYGVTWLRDGLNKIDLSLTGTSNTKPYFNYLELEYTSLLLPVNNNLDLPLGNYDGQAQIDVVDNFEYPVLILDIADPLNPVILNNFSRSQGTISFSVALESNAPNRFFLTTPQTALSPESIRREEPSDLYATDVPVDLIIVTTQSLSGALEEYIDYRQSQGVKIKVVDVEDIYNNFSFGLFDPTAIRDYLKYAYENYPAPAPSAVLFVGDGNYDYLDHLQSGVPNFVPSYLRPNDESASDDNYVYFGTYGILDSDTSYLSGDRGFDMLTARWPVRTAEEISIITNKIKQYESPSSFGVWRNNIVLVADDEYGHFNTETFHTTQTEELEKNHIPRHFHRDKIYLWEYPFVNREKPAVNDEIVNSINDGALLVNYVGHGNPDVWAHEHVFTRSGDVPRLNNIDKLPLVFTASCAIGFFDDPKREGMAEDLLIHPSGGAIAVVSATRLVYASENAAFNQKVFDMMLPDDSLTIAEAVYVAKLLRQYRSSNVPIPIKNDRAYLLLGDPYIHLGMPKLQVAFSESPDSLTALQQIHVAGQIINSQGQPFIDDGQLAITVFDSDRQKTYRLVNDTGGTIQTIDYSVTGPAIFRGTAAITDGHFDFVFIPPLDLSYGGEGAGISVYAKFSSTDGVGLIDSLPVSSVVAPTSDSSGPAISYRFQGQTDFISGDIINADDILEISLEDSSGINLAGALGHGITLTLDNLSEKAVNLTKLFAYDQDNFTRGELTYGLGNLEPGQHTFKIKAWDNANNSAVVEFSAVVQSQEHLAIVDLLNYPNPMKESTRFSFLLTQQVGKVELDIFTLSGRKIKTFERYPAEAGYFDDIVWYGKDSNGDRIATGVYIYKATAIPANGGKAVEAFGKVVVVN